MLSREAPPPVVCDTDVNSQEVARRLEDDDLPGIASDHFSFQYCKKDLERILNVIASRADNGDLTWESFHTIVGMAGNYVNNECITQTLLKYGYEGLVSVEGEPPKVDNHDSIVIFDASDIEIISETEV